MADREPAAEEPKPDATPASPEGGNRTAIALMLAGLAIAVGVVLYLRSSPPGPSRPAGRAGNLVEMLESKGRKAAAEKVRAECASGMTCGCRQASAAAALDADLHAEASTAFDGDAECAKQPASRGMLAEALARAGKPDEAVAKANELVASGAQDPYATYALASASMAKGDNGAALRDAALAVSRGRGAAAHLLAAVIHHRAGAYDDAKRELDAMLKLDPNDIDALYNLALIAQLQNRYRDAREGYLKVLTVAPKHADSRYNLAILTHSVGAVQESRHNLEALKAIVPANDERVVKLEALLAAQPAAPAAAPSASAP